MSYDIRPQDRERVLALRRRGHSVRSIARLTGHSTNTVRAHVGNASIWGVIRAPDSTGSCERCGLHASSHSPSAKARRAKQARVCERAVVTCEGCGGWRSPYSASRCMTCYRELASRRELEWLADEPARMARRETRRQRRLLRQGGRVLTNIRQHLRAPARSPLRAFTPERTSPTS